MEDYLEEKSKERYKNRLANEYGFFYIRENKSYFDQAKNNWFQDNQIRRKFINRMWQQKPNWISHFLPI